MRRVHVPDLHPGVISADPTQAHHLRTVLRLAVGDRVEAFDASGRTAVAVVTALEPTLTLHAEAVTDAPPRPVITVASAVPKGDRADWMVEKLSEIGVNRFIPLRTARSVVHPEGNKTDRWHRIAVEAAKQSRRPGVLTIDRLIDVRKLLPTLQDQSAVFFSTRPSAEGFNAIAAKRHSAFLLIGPEGGWTDDEETAFVAAGLTPASLGRTILRIETAAVLAAGLTLLLDRPA
ncbi:MAG: RsmE family RNA methyltransferase [Tepidisphaeraceae bacterium]